MRRLTFLVSAATCICGLTISTCPVAHGQSASLNLEAWLSSPRVVAGEPVVLFYRIANRSSETVSLNLGGVGSSGIHITVADQLGRTIPRGRPYREFATTFQLSPPPQLAPGASEEGSVVLTRLFQFSRPARYTVIASVEAPATLINSVPTAHVQTEPSRVTMQVTMSARSDIVLQRQASSLVRQVIQKSGKYVFAIEQLMSMPEDVCLPLALHVAGSLLPDDVRYGQITRELERIGSPASLSVLSTLNQTASDKRWRAGELKDARRR